MRSRLVPLAVCLAAGALASAQDISLELLGRYQTGVFDEGACEIVAHDRQTQRLFIINGDTGAIDVVCIADPTNPSLQFSIDLSPWGDAATSVAVCDGLIATAVVAEIETDPGRAVFFNADGEYLADVEVGALPDMITFTPDGRYVLTANEGQPSADYTIDPEGSVSVIHIPRSPNGINQDQVKTASFAPFNGADLDESIRIFGPGATVAQDLEPEYIAFSADSRTAYIACQENNALAVVDVKKAKVTALVGLGFKDHSLAGNGIDASNRDGAINITTWPVLGMYQPDALASYTVDGETYIVSANEGDARDYDGYSEEERVGDLPLDPVAFPDAATLQLDENLGRLNSTTATGDFDGDGDFDAIFAYGARSFSIWNSAGELVWDSGDALEQITAAAYPDDFNSTNDENMSFDNRSDDKGPEPEGVTIGQFNGQTYAFVGLERIGGIMVYNVSDPTAPQFVQYINTRDFSGDPAAGTAGDLGPEGLIVIPAADSPIGEPLLVVGHEVSGSTAIFRIKDAGAAMPLPGDVNGDGRVNGKDIRALTLAMGACDCYCPGDLNGDGFVDELDLVELLGLIRGR